MYSVRDLFSSSHPSSETVRQPIAAGPGGLPISFSGPQPWLLLAIFILLATCVGILGWWAYTAEADYLRQRRYIQLTSIANFKAAQVGDWLAERRGDVQYFGNSPFFRNDARLWLNNRSPAAAERIKKRFEGLMANQNYTGIELIDRSGITRLAVESSALGRILPPQILASMSASAEPLLIDLHREDKNSPIRLAYLMPIPAAEAGKVLGYLRLNIDPGKHLYPLLQASPTASASGETLLLRREGDSALFLNDMRLMPNTALQLRVPLSVNTLSAAQLAFGAESRFEGWDYRGVKVLGFGRPIPGTPWQLVAKIDRAEVFGPIKQLAVATAVVAFVLLSSTATMLWMIWRRQQMSVRLNLHQELERIADVSPSVFHSYCLQPDGSASFPYGSRAIQSILGFPPERLAHDASPVITRIHPDDIKRVREENYTSARDLSVWQAEFRYFHPLKGEVWIEGKSVPSRMPDNSVVWYGFLSDVTERKRADQALRESEQRFSTVFRDSPLGIAITQISDGLVIEANDSLLGIFDLAREQFIGQTSTALGLWGSDTERAQLLARFQTERVLRNVEVQFRHSSGRMLDVLFSASIIRLAGGEYLLSLFSDITQLRRTEKELLASRERYQSLFERMLDGYILCRVRFENDMAVDFCCLDANPAFEQLTGLHDVLGKWFGELVPNLRESSPDLLETIGRVTRTGCPARLETYIASLDKWFAIAAFSDEPEHFAAVFHNITERKQAQLALEAHRNQLEATVVARTAELVSVNKELQAFTYAASHDLKAPLRNISGFADLLERNYADRLDADGARCLDYIVQSANRMAALIDDLLAYAHLEQQPQHIRSIDLAQAVQVALAECRGENPQDGADIRVDLPPITVQADARGLAQALRNLVGNALKYSAKTPHPRIEIGAEKGSERCKLWVKDNGIGFDMAYHDRIFEVFRRLHSTQEFQGTGVGLALVKKAVERMGGKVWAESAPGQGATFFVELPSG